MIGFRNLQEKIRKEEKKKVLEEIIVDKWCFLVKTLTMLLLDHYRTQNANNACMSYKNEVKMYNPRQAQESRLDSMALPVMEFQVQGYKIQKIFA